ncbi:MAG: antibiotic biosynthesis monooxygenase [Kangiellaceae bacterium]|nr:antibiotic biosynthesis monooxygenase [Kangiellaceae bacterium]MCW8998775.1 antibiotic biosynthesis monooxygenase [Kangiellaceae bacterium]
MVLEHALLKIIPGQQHDFEKAFSQAQSIIAGIKGYRKHSLSRCIEMPNTYLLLVEWECLEDHTHGFRLSPEYQQWKILLHHFYTPFPEVIHFNQVNFTEDFAH